MSSIQLHLLGQFQFQREDGSVVVIAQPRLQSLLAYLALHRDAPQARQHLAFLFWPDSSESQARTNLRRTLHEARLALPDFDLILISSHQWLQWRPDAALKVDVALFEQQLATAARLFQSQELAAAINAFAQAVDLYQGPFLRDCYDGWALRTRANLDERYSDALQRLVDLAEEQRAYDQAIAYAHRLLRYDPLSESVYQRLMRLHALKGDRAAALRLYHECAAMLARELGVEASAETRAAHLQLLNTAAPLPLPDSLSSPGSPAPKLVGRQKEWQRLRLAWEEARRGHAQVVAISGEAGIGKTRLAEELTAWLQRQGLRTSHSRAYQAQEALAYAPLIELLRAEPVQAQIERMAEPWRAAIARLLPEWRDSLAPASAPAQTDEPAQRQHFYEALARALLGEPGEARPQLLLLDDLHWCDRETLEWLRFLLHFAPNAPLLLVITLRSGEVALEHPLHTWLLALHGQQLLTDIPLARLNQEETATLATQVAGRTLAADQTAKLYARSEGNPFFVVEMVRAGSPRWSAGGEPGEFEDALPARVQAVILARLSQLTPPAQEAAQLAATMGRSFSPQVLAQAGAYGEDALVAALDELWRRHLVVEQGAQEYDFSHPLVREVAYSQIAPMRRRLFHRRIAQSLAALHAGEVESVSARMALHYEAAGDVQEAIDAYQSGARFARQTYAYQEATVMLQKAIDLLEALPADQARHKQAIELYLELGWAFQLVPSESTPRSRELFNHALDLCKTSRKWDESGPRLESATPEWMQAIDARIAEAIWGLRLVDLGQGNLQKAAEASELCLYFATRSNHTEMMLQAHHALWGVYIYSYTVPNALQAVLEHTQKGLDLYYSANLDRYDLTRVAGHDPGTCAYRLRSRCQWLLGYPDQALQTIEAGIALAAELNHAFTTRQVLMSTAKTHYYRGEVHEALADIEKSLHCEPEPIKRPTYIDGVVLQGWALAQLGQAAEIVAGVQEACTRRIEAGELFEMPFFLALLAEIYECAGQIERARATTQQALAIAEQNHEDHWQPELHRLSGRYHQAAGDLDAAAASFRHAIELAQTHAIKSLELRAALDLSRLWAEQGQRVRAYDLLSGVYNWFSEGFNTADLRAAQELLQTLAPAEGEKGKIRAQSPRDLGDQSE